MAFDYKIMARAAVDSAERFDWSRECTCDSESGWCWYRLTVDEQEQERVQFIADAIQRAVEEWRQSVR